MRDDVIEVACLVVAICVPTLIDMLYVLVSGFCDIILSPFHLPEHKHHDE